MTEFKPLRHIPHANVFRKGDVFVLFGELFGRGYVNGLIDEARAAGMTISRWKLNSSHRLRTNSGLPLIPALRCARRRSDGSRRPFRRT